jgi:hypothetical protein
MTHLFLALKKIGNFDSSSGEWRERDEHGKFTAAFEIELIPLNLIKNNSISTAVECHPFPGITTG